MTGPYRVTVPSTAAVASSTGANALTATINAVTGVSMLIHGVDISYDTVSSRHHVRLETGGAIAWSQYLGDNASWDFPRPLEMTRAASIQAIADQPAGSNSGRLSIRYGYERT